MLTAPDAVSTKSVAVKVTVPVVCSAVMPVTMRLERLVYAIVVKSANTEFVATGAFAAAHKKTVTLHVESLVKL